MVLADGWSPSRLRGGVIVSGCWRFRDDKAEAGERQARGGRGMTGARWDDSRDDCCGKTIGVMVRLPVWGKGGWRERDGPADSAGRSASRRMECD